LKLEMKYDRAGRSEGTAFVTYESHADAKEAIKEYNGANAAGKFLGTMCESCSNDLQASLSA